MSARDRSAKAGWVKLMVALLCTAAAGTFIYLRLRGPVPARVDPAIEAAGGLMGRRTARSAGETIPIIHRPERDAAPREPGAAP
jgi:uncharacterized membrane protein